LLHLYVDVQFDSSASADEAEQALTAFEAAWGEKYRSVVRTWRDSWASIIPFFQFPPELRRVSYTTNAIESLNMSLQKLTRNRRLFTNDEAAVKALFLAMQEASRKWKMVHHWKPALQDFQVMFGGERVPVSAL